jgi:hypothetical protein
MTIITLPPELEAPLAEAARRQGTSPELLAIESLRKQFAPTPQPNGVETAAEGKTLYDVLKDYIGAIDSSEIVPGGANLSEDSGKKFTQLLLEKQRRKRP